MAHLAGLEIKLQLARALFRGDRAAVLNVYGSSASPCNGQAQS